LWAGGMAGIAVGDWAIAHVDTTDTLKSVRALRFGGTLSANMNETLTRQ
jgi:hypothetical protein